MVAKVYQKSKAIDRFRERMYEASDKVNQNITMYKAMSIFNDYLEEISGEQRWIPVSERLPELNKPLLVTAYHRVCYAHMISESGNYGYPVFRLHEIKDSDRGWVQETISHEPYSMGRIDAWMYIDIPEPYKVEPQESEEV